MITDHEHESAPRPGLCAACGGLINQHLSWGSSVAAELGGQPEEYITEYEE